MAGKTSNIYIRIEPEIKKEAEEILETLGIGASQAVNMFYKQIILHKGMPFDVNIPDGNTIRPKKVKPVINKEESASCVNNEPIVIKEETPVVTKPERQLTQKEIENRTIEEIKKKYGL
ncbi:MAG: type II toxin-antitoxin system RelB/DinJ family antitoxin [Firmicutes bacterium]|nr:type II toxin-antitoxin system RelB/DinJ family antitoxin [Bacillota bacterium]MDY3091907.1 type II toxin-antitoxin system RelB/DinJ family antitoxin [Erysipelotrichaceae bacterium]